MKRLAAMILSTIMILAAAVPPVFAAESWRDAFVTRLMKVLSQDPTYTDIILTDLDQNGIPEAFVVKDGANGGISAAFTLQNNTIISLNTPNNIIGNCLGDVTVYNDNGTYRFIGKEVPRYTSVIYYYLIQFDGNTVTCTKVNKNDYSALPTVPYQDMHGDDFLTSGYPNRTKIKAFVDSYEPVNALTAVPSDAKVTVNGASVEVSGYNINYNNYYKIRDIAMVLRTTPSRFDVTWDAQKNAINIQTGTKYTIIGGELSQDPVTGNLSIEENQLPILLNGLETELEAYNINGNNYFKIRDLADAAGFDINWNEETQTVEISTY